MSFAGSWAAEGAAKPGRRRAIVDPRLAAWALAVPLAAWGADWAPPQRADRPAAASCVKSTTPGLDGPRYPREAYRLGLGGRVKVTLWFGQAAAEPAVVITEHDGDPSFADAVRVYAQTLRVPCLEPFAAPVGLAYEFIFRPGDGRANWARPTLPMDERDRVNRVYACVEHVDGLQKPELPRLPDGGFATGIVFTRFTFGAASSPPRVEAFAASNSRRQRALKGAVERWASGLRAPCMPEGRVTLEVLYSFALEGQAAYEFKPMALSQFLSLTRGIRDATLQWDTTEMGCPFEVSITHLRPHAPNWVGEHGQPHPARRAMLEWLEMAELDVGHRDYALVFGTHALVSVPCMRIDLKP